MIRSVSWALAKRRQNGTRRRLRNRSRYCRLALDDLEQGEVCVNTLEGIADRAIEFTNKVLHTLPSYRPAAIDGLRKLRSALEERSPGDPAIAKLDTYLESLRPSGDPVCDSSLT